MTFRSFILGLSLLTASCILITYNDYAYNNTFLSGGSHFPIAAIFFVIMLSACINPLMTKFRLGRPFGQGEIITVWCMVAAGIGIPASGLLRYLMPYMVAPFYYANNHPNWMYAFHDYIPSWLVPSKDPTSPVVMMFYEGAHGEAIPWQAWVVPFFGWGILLAGAYLTMFCLTAIIRKQWVEHERLTFPLALIPLEISASPQPGRLFNTLLSSRTTWIGASIPIFFWTLAGLNALFPGVPYISHTNFDLAGIAREFRGWYGFFHIFFIPIGVSFLLTSEVSLSLWVFFLLNNVQRVTRVNLGYGLAGGFDRRQQFGAYAVFAALSLWTMRHHLKDVFRKAFLNAEDVDDSHEGLPYRWAVCGLLTGQLIIIGWLYALGTPLLASLLFLVVVMVILLVLSRVVAQSGLLLIQTSYITAGPLGMVQDVLSNRYIGAGGLTAMSFHQAPLYCDAREVMMPTLLNNVRMGENRVNLRRLFIAMMIAVAVSFTVSYYSQVIGYYQFGAANINPYSTLRFPQNSLSGLAEAIETIDRPQVSEGWTGILHVSVGGAIFLFVYLMRASFTWWFIHPIGVLVAATYPMTMLWASIFIGWLCKVLARAFARGPAMAKVKHFFIGLIIGDSLITIIWAAVGFFAQRSIIHTFPM